MILHIILHDFERWQSLPTYLLHYHIYLLHISALFTHMNSFGNLWIAIKPIETNQIAKTHWREPLKPFKQFILHTMPDLGPGGINIQNTSVFLHENWVLCKNMFYAIKQMFFALCFAKKH